MKDIENKQELIDTLLNAISKGTDHLYAKVGEYEGELFVIFEDWGSVYNATGIINGFNGLKNKPYIPKGSLVVSELDKVKDALSKDPDNYNLKRTKDALLSHLLYEQYLASYNIDPIELDDIVEFGFSDEWDLCCECGKVLRTSPDSYCWAAPLFIDAEGYVCEECVASGKFDEYILEEYCNQEKSIPDSFDLDRLGLVKINKEPYQNGFHYGMDDSPQPIIKALNEQNISVWFKVYPSQFYIEFDVLVKQEQEQQAIDVLNGVNTYQGFSSAGNCEKGLKEAGKLLGGLKGDGIKYATINSDGTANVRLVSPEEFVKGIK